MKLRPWVKYALLIGVFIVMLLILIQILNNNAEKSIERRSIECAEKGYGIKAQYTKEGDKYYVCNVK